MSLRDLQDVARHADPKTTRRYEVLATCAQPSRHHAIAHYLAGGN